MENANIKIKFNSQEAADNMKKKIMRALTKLKVGH